MSCTEPHKVQKQGGEQKENNSLTKRDLEKGEKVEVTVLSKTDCSMIRIM
jgi:hypothetical protein